MFVDVYLRPVYFVSIGPEKSHWGSGQLIYLFYSFSLNMSHCILLNSDWTDISLAPIMEGFVILKKNPEYEKTESWVVQTISSL